MIFCIALAIRLVCLYLFRNVSNYDTQSYLQVGELTLKKINIYPDIANLHHPYLPFFLYFEAFAVWFGKSKIIILLIIKLINVLFDFGIMYFVYLLSKKNLWTTFIYAINPITILITTLHGQFDVIPVFFILLSIYFRNKKQDLFFILSYSFAFLIKTWPVLFVIPILRKMNACHPRENRDPECLDTRHLLFILIAFFPILFTVIYCWLFKISPIDIGKTLINYHGLWGIWGPWALLGKRQILFQKLTTIIFLTSFFGYSWHNKGKNLIKNILSLLFFFFVFTTNFSIQYFVWIIPFLILIKPKNYFKLIILIFIYLLSFYSVWTFCFKCKSIPYWFVFLQNCLGFVLWIVFIKFWYLSRKIY